MKRKRIAQELIKLARSLVSMKFDTEEEKKKYQQEHNVRPGTKLTVKKPSVKAPAKETNKADQEKALTEYHKAKTDHDEAWNKYLKFNEENDSKWDEAKKRGDEVTMKKISDESSQLDKAAYELGKILDETKAKAGVSKYEHRFEVVGPRGNK
jgi:hypothetical protein